MMMGGKLDRKITILRKTETLSSSGDPIELWAPTIRRRSASVWPLKGSEKFATAEKIATEQLDVRIRYSSDVADITPLDRIIYPALVVGEDPDDAPARTVLDIIEVQEINRREGIKIIAVRRPDIYIVDVSSSPDSPPVIPPGGPSLDFSNPDNSMYVTLI